MEVQGPPQRQQTGSVTQRHFPLNPTHTKPFAPTTNCRERVQRPLLINVVGLVTIIDVVIAIVQVLLSSSVASVVVDGWWWKYKKDLPTRRLVQRSSSTNVLVSCWLARDFFLFSSILFYYFSLNGRTVHLSFLYGPVILLETSSSVQPTRTNAILLVVTGKWVTQWNHGECCCYLEHDVAALSLNIMYWLTTTSL